ncbi:NADH dehydrogenase [ubiquinone] 1 alpha subcomplex subunit 8-like [Ruditapes philippinarum]|uniref:NADH dehydrogenase [ubiquinone] 1 alpha subcomplex subunit 8-like n=1 Tax=Ruditapes philippinarum TaxID=129788 RepID=UPI001E6BA120
MPFTETFNLPARDELMMQEIKLTFPAMKAASLHMGKYCDDQSKEFMLCKSENGKDPRPCLNEGKEVTRCGMEFLQKVKKSCAESFTDYWKCLDTQHELKFRFCRKYQTIFDNCVEEQIGLTRPDIMHFMKIRLHKTNRPKPEEPELPAPLADPDLNREPSNPHYRRYGFSK